MSFSFRPLPLMTALMLAAFALLLTLGAWQKQKFDFKRAAAEAPVAEMTLAAYEPLEDGVQLVYGVREGQPGWRVLAPVLEGDTIVFVDSDWVAGATLPDWREVRYPAALRFGAPVVGASIRPGEPSPFAPPPRPLERIWFDIDLQAMGRGAGAARVADYYIATPYLGVDGRAAPNPFAVAPGTDPLPPERHLGYALTWYGLALVLLGVYFAYHASTGRLRFGPARKTEE